MRSVVAIMGCPGLDVPAYSMDQLELSHTGAVCGAVRPSLSGKSPDRCLHSAMVSGVAGPQATCPCQTEQLNVPLA